MSLYTEKDKICLAQVKDSQFYTILETNDRLLSLKLIEMGCMKGMKIEKLNSAPFYGPILFKVYPNGNLLALRHEEAKKLILIKPFS
jgi:ferrous iron transport protein A